MAEGSPYFEEYQNWQNIKESSVNMPVKRKSSGSGTQVSAVPSKKKKISGLVPTKNAVQALNEYKTGTIFFVLASLVGDVFTGLEYVVLNQSGPSHAPHFQIGVNLNGRQFVGAGG